MWVCKEILEGTAGVGGGFAEGGGGRGQEHGRGGLAVIVRCGAGEPEDARRAELKLWVAELCRS